MITLPLLMLLAAHSASPLSPVPFADHCALPAPSSTIWPTTLDFASVQSVSVLSAPQSVTIAEDDRNAIIEWDGGVSTVVTALPSGVGGYRILWGPVGVPYTKQGLTEHRRFQMQPLEPGVQYHAQVQAVGYDGDTSIPTPERLFQHSSARVDALRQQMNGFFDDFNLPMGLPDERKWNVAYSACTIPERNGFFINSQFHVHNSVTSSDCVKGLNANRPRANLSFSDNGTRTITFDLDGEKGRDSWYLDLLPIRADAYGYVDDFAVSSPGGGLRLLQSGGRVQFVWIGPSGIPSFIADTNWNPFPSLEHAGREFISNVRRHWEYRISRTHAELFIDGTKVLETPPGTFTLPLNEYTVGWQVFTYNTPKGNHVNVLVHWDNFGFDAPSGTPVPNVVHNYRMNNGGTDFIRVDRSDPALRSPTVHLNIPDVVDGTLQRRLMFTLQMWSSHTYAWSPQDKVVVNGNEFPLPEPTSYGLNPILRGPDVVAAIIPYTSTIELPPAVLVRGDNSIRFDLTKSGVMNIHAELEFPRNQEPTYTSPAIHAIGPALPDAVRIGPDVSVSRLGTTEILTYQNGLNDPAQLNPTVAGTITIDVNHHHAVALIGNGSNAGTIELGLVVDGQVRAVKRTDTSVASPGGRYTFGLDTSTLSNGMHQLYVYGCNSLGDPQLNSYGEHNAEIGAYFPLHFTSNNPGRPSQPFVASTFDAFAACQGALTGPGAIFRNDFEAVP